MLCNYCNPLERHIRFRESSFSPTALKTLSSSSLEEPPSFHMVWIDCDTRHLPEGFTSQSLRSRACCASCRCHRSHGGNGQCRGKGKTPMTSFQIDIFTQTKTIDIYLFSCRYIHSNKNMTYSLGPPCLTFALGLVVLVWKLWKTQGKHSGPSGALEFREEHWQRPYLSMPQ